MPENVFTEILVLLKPLYGEFSELLQELRDHQLSIVENIKASVDERSRLLVLKARESGGYTPLPKIYNHSVEIVQTLSDEHNNNVHRMPSVLMDGSTKLYADEYDENGRKQSYTPDNYEDLAGGPTVVIPIRKLQKKMEALRAQLKMKRTHKG